MYIIYKHIFTYILCTRAACVGPNNNHSLYSLQATAVYTVAPAATDAAELGLLRTFGGDEASGACNNISIHEHVYINIYIYICTCVYTYL